MTATEGLDLIVVIGPAGQARQEQRPQHPDLRATVASINRADRFNLVTGWIKRTFHVRPQSGISTRRHPADHAGAQAECAGDERGHQSRWLRKPERFAQRPVEHRVDGGPDQWCEWPRKPADEDLAGG